MSDVILGVVFITAVYATTAYLTLRWHGRRSDPYHPPMPHDGDVRE